MQRPSKIGGPFSLNRGQATGPVVSPKANNSEHRTKIYTFLTKAPQTGTNGTAVLYTGDRLWAKVTLRLETAGPVAVGDASDLSPVLSGKGQLLTTGEPFEFVIAKGTTLYIAATGVNRVKVTIEPFPWLEAIVGQIQALIGGIAPAVLDTIKNAF